MKELPENLRSVDWTQTTFEGARREQLRRWAELPLDRVIASLEEMEALTAQWRTPPSSDVSAQVPRAGWAPIDRSDPFVNQPRTGATDIALLAHDPALAEIVRRLVEAYQPQRIYLFGSKARGDEGPDSDYDLLVVVPDGATSEHCDSRLAYDVLWGVRTAADVIVWTQTAFDRRARVPASLPAIVLREGKLVHAA